MRSGDGQLLLSVSGDDRVRAWSLSEARELSPPPVEVGPLADLAVAGTRLLVAGPSGSTCNFTVGSTAPTTEPSPGLSCRANLNQARKS